MNREERERIGFICAYTPVALIEAAGFGPYRILPHEGAPDLAGAHLHDNLCPHVKRVLNRALAGEIPELAGTVLMGCCDAVRRLADVWRVEVAAQSSVLLELPVAGSERSVDYFCRELQRFAADLVRWGGHPIADDDLERSLDGYNALARGLSRLQDRAAAGTLPGGRAALQEMHNLSVTVTLSQALDELARIEAQTATGGSPPNLTSDADRGTGPAKRASRADRGTPVYLAGNVLSDPQAFTMLEECGCHIIADDLCTGSRQLEPIASQPGGNPWERLARGLLRRTPCARALEPAKPGYLAEALAGRALDCGARGVIVHVMKFCDPYLARLPLIRRRLKQNGLPLLVLEGDCTLRSIGQQRTRIEAFVEMLSR